MKTYLPARPPFSLNSVVHSHGWIRLAPFQEDETNGGFHYVDELSSGSVVLLYIHEADQGVWVETEVELTPVEENEICHKVTWMLGLDQVFESFYELAASEPKLAKVAKKAQGRILRSATFFEDTIKTILTTNTSWSGTIRMVNALVTLYGASFPGDSLRHAFPTPATLANSDVETLRTAARLGYRAPYVLELAQTAAAGSLDLESFKTSDLPTAELRKQILAIKGVGGYAAANLLMLLGRYDFVPVDSWALKVVSHEWHGGQPVGSADVEQAFESWGEWKGLAYWLWDWTFIETA
jgi:3-methyladenine DNA glycosylase/8-oxoguanine DNA glycosylase